MDKDTVLVPTGQEISDTPQQGRAVEHFNSEGRPLQAAPPGGRGNPSTSATGGYFGRTPRMGVAFSGSAGNTHVARRRNIWYEGRTYKGLDNGGDKKKVPRTETVGQTDQCDKPGVSRGAHRNGTDMNDDGANP